MEPTTNNLLQLALLIKSIIRYSCASSSEEKPIITASDNFCLQIHQIMHFQSSLD